ncbi:hypothetical protein BJ978_002820 [Agromyces terreus]|uniref:DUF2157 domain-containing protein n=1 Tax=Agromyces terreus TaxID=424795 RepID=A0A9X2KCZ8_9MICO|nr:hypothetical protein [Agromyces terreus]MCP2372144.1 hypothetical protein [Agromyces terreus]
MSDHPAGMPAELPRWPADPARFVDTASCPSCLSPLTAARCAVCGLDLAVPDAAELLASGRRIHDEGLRRRDLIRRMYAAQATAAAPAPAPPVSAVTAPTVPAQSPAPATWVAPAAPTAPAAPAAARSLVEGASAPTPQASRPAATAPAAPRRSGVQVLLLTLGVVLISVAAIVFLFVAYLVASLEVRSVIIAVASLLVLGAAWLLRARRLPGTAEGVASVAVVLLLLDIWIVRANGLFGTDRLDGAAYTGGAFLVVAALLAATRASSGIRVPGHAAAILVPTGVFLMGLGASPDDEPGTAVWLGGLAASLAGSLAAFAPRGPERTVAVGAGYLGGVLALAAAPLALPSLEWHQLWSFLGSAAAWALALLSARRMAQPAWQRIAAAAAGLALALAFAVPIADELEPETAIWAAPTAAGLIACILALLVGRRAPRRTDAAYALGAAATVALLAAGFGAVIGIGSVTDRITGSVPPWSGGVGASFPTPSTLQAAAAWVPVVVALGSTTLLFLIGRLRPLRAVPIAALGAAAILAGAVIPSDPWSMTLLLGIGAGALALTVSPPKPPVDGPALAVRLVLAAVGVSSAALGWIVGFSDPAIWPWSASAALLLLIAARLTCPRICGPQAAPVIALAHSALLGILVAITLAALVPWLEALGVAFADAGTTGWLCLGTGAGTLVGLAALPRIAPQHDRVAFALPMLLAAMQTIASLPLQPSNAQWTWAPPAVLALAGAFWLRRSAPQPLRVVFAALVPIAIATAAAAAAVTVPGAELGYVLAGTALVTAALAHLLARPRADSAAAAWIAAVVVVVAAALSTVLLTSGEAWLTLLVLAPVPLVLASVFSDPVAGDAPTRHLSWFSAVLAIGAVYAWLAGRGVDDVEAYTLPLAAMLAACGALITWRRDPSTATVSPGRTALFASAAAIAVLPSVGSTAASDLRTLILVAAGAVVTLAAMFAPESSRGVPVRLIAATTGWTGMTGAALVRGSALAGGAESALPVEFWPVLSALAGLALAVAWARTSSHPAALAEWIAAASVVLSAIPSVVAIMAADRASLRAAILLLVLGAAVVAGTATRARPFGGPVFSWAARGTLVLAGLLALVSGNVDPADVITVPVALALIAVGAIAMARTGIGSWPALGPGIGLLLLPPLGADFTDPQLWRIVALGAAALTSLVIGAQRRWQAPFLLGGGVLLVHAIVQFWPAITALYEAVWWWLWLGIAGVLLVVLAATYERQVRLARTAIRSISAMR